MSEKALIAMSGGVDSSVAACLMKDKGYECIGCTMKLYDNEDTDIDYRTCKVETNITKQSLDRCVEGQKVVVKIIKELGNNNYLGEITKVLGHKNDPGVDILSIACEHEIILDFNDEVMNQVASLPMEVLPNEMMDRKDLRNEVIFTIDGDDTKDIDDALSLEILENGNYKLGVHIADVSYYVKRNSCSPVISLFLYSNETLSSSAEKCFHVSV